MQNMSDSWLSGNPYERFMGRWSILVAQRFLEWLDIPPARIWSDVGCGTGSLTKLILETYQPKEIFSFDPSEDFISYAQRLIADPSVHFKVDLAQSLELHSHSIDAVVSGLALNFMPQPGQALSEMIRVAKPGGIVAAYVWDYAEGMQMLRYFWDAAVALDGDAAELDEGVRFPLCQEARLRTLFLESGLREVTLKSVEVPTVFSDFEEYWHPFLGGIGPAPSYVMNLKNTQRNALEERLQSSLPRSENGTISLVARAWAIQGTV